MANPFSPAQIDFSPLADLPLQFERGQQIKQQRDIRDVRKSLRNGEMDYGSAFQSLLSAGDIQGANAVDQARQRRDSLALQQQRLAQTAQGQGGVFGTPIYGTDAQGNTVLGVIGKDGTFRQIDTGGVTPTPGLQFVDQGTSVQPVDKRTGAYVGGAIPVDVAGKKYQEQEGKDRGDNAALLSNMESKLPGLKDTVDKLDALSEKATYTTAGQAYNRARQEFGAQPTEGAVARTEYIATVDNQILPLLRDTFGAAFTQKEGETLRATLGAPNKTPQEKQAVLKAFIAQKERDIEALRARVGGSTPPRTQGGMIPPSAVQFLKQNADDPAVREQFRQHYRQDPEAFLR